MIEQNRLQFWIQQNLNVLLEGRHGVGKTSVIFEELERQGIKYAYFSGATMDPWVDFVGVPRPVNDAKGSYLELVIPKKFRDEEVELIFMDEFNRSHAKVRNACMELIQFKSINGRKFPKLRMVWAAINPYDENNEYDTEGLDPSQLDRFHVHYKIPFELNETYLAKKYGFETASLASQWWHEIPEEFRHHISPRRLDYALEVFTSGGLSYIRDIIPSGTNGEINVEALEIALEEKGLTVADQLLKLKEKDDQAGARKILDNPVFWIASENAIEEIEELRGFAVPLLSSERILSFIAQDKNNEIVKCAFLNEQIKSHDLTLSDEMKTKVQQWLSYVYNYKYPKKEEDDEPATTDEKEKPVKKENLLFVEKDDDDFEDHFNRESGSEEKLLTLLEKVDKVGGAAKLSEANKEKLYKKLYAYMPEELSEGTAKQVLLAIDGMLKKTSGTTFPEILQMVNNCLYNLQGKKIPLMNNIQGYAGTPAGLKRCELRPTTLI